jgi:two-component system chemotaxis response regulator CheB
MQEPRAFSRVIAVGASAGGIDALRRLFAGLPAGLDAAVCVVLHIPARSPSVLAQILDRAGPLPVATAEDGAKLVAGHALVAPPDHHLLVREGHVELSRGPKEHGLRPAIDPTFRSLAVAYGPRAVGVVLSGALHDGAAGVAVLHDRGGTVFVQDPDEALVRSMPDSAIASGDPWRVLPVAELGPALAELRRGRATRADERAAPADVAEGVAS